MIYILTHGRPHNQKTVETLRRCGYTGDITLVLDDEDKTLSEYKEEDRLHIRVFSKQDYIDKTDTGMLNPLRNFAVFARNAIEDIAKEDGVEYFCMFDDDIKNFRHRTIEENKLLSSPVVNFDSVLYSYIEYMKQTNIACLSFGTTSQYIGGIKRFNQVKEDNNTLRLCFNAYIRDSKVDVNWKLNMCEDRITSIYQNTYGNIWKQLLFIQLDCSELYGIIEGGNSEVYRMLDEYTQTFFPIITHPASNKVADYHGHLITRLTGEDNLFAKIISGGYKK